MCKQMEHRGPNELCIVETENAVLGISRLKIIGLGNNEQPVYNSDKSLLAVFNGEIYNHRLLSDELKRLVGILKVKAMPE